jgi:hypothetical protein
MYDFTCLFNFEKPVMLRILFILIFYMWWEFNTSIPAVVAELYLLDGNPLNYNFCASESLFVFIAYPTYAT